MTTRKPITQKQIAMIHTLVSQLGWEDEEYRDWLRSRCNVDSSKDLTAAQAYQLTRELLNQPTGDEAITKRQFGRLCGLEREIRERPGYSGFSLAAWLLNHGYRTPNYVYLARHGQGSGVVIGQLSKEQASKAIQALERMLDELDRKEHSILQECQSASNE